MALRLIPLGVFLKESFGMPICGRDMRFAIISEKS